ncbi:FAD-dependent oxidoreductase [Niabella hibiscisoli]|uniref:FAD-dependent oxidoreductase n=1 Tax=Niabella hibiscisoli TaxID=1825928 RepID=UPI001F0E513F|nr:FAD-dependent oxidoreductase [Niabella hibiscisoli]MCH5719369.1 FAD-dependent oxidoreductase [Niabella hibiscisoli]
MILSPGSSIKNVYDLVVVGGGALGTFHAYHALMGGLSVALVERNELPMGATVRNFGQVVPSGMNSKWQLYGRSSLAIYGTLQSEFDISVRKNGSVYLASNLEERVLLEELFQINRSNDYPSELLTREQCLKNIRV